MKKKNVKIIDDEKERKSNKKQLQSTKSLNTDIKGIDQKHFT